QQRSIGRDVVRGRERSDAGSVEIDDARPDVRGPPLRKVSAQPASDSLGALPLLARDDDLRVRECANPASVVRVEMCQDDPPNITEVESGRRDLMCCFIACGELESRKSEERIPSREIP